VQRGDVRGALCGSLVSCESLRLHARVGVSWRHFCVANDIRHASCVSPAHRELGKTSPAVCPARALEFCFWTHGTDRSTYFHVVGPGSSDHSARGSSLACVHFAVLPCVEEGPFSEDFRGSPARLMNC